MPGSLKPGGVAVAAVAARIAAAEASSALRIGLVMVAFPCRMVIENGAACAPGIAENDASDQRRI
jgi:hypothetical protein